MKLVPISSHLQSRSHVAELVDVLRAARPDMTDQTTAFLVDMEQVSLCAAEKWHYVLAHFANDVLAHRKALRATLAQHELLAKDKQLADAVAKGVEAAMKRMVGFECV